LYPAISPTEYVIIFAYSDVVRKIPLSLAFVLDVKRYPEGSGLKVLKKFHERNPDKHFMFYKFFVRNHHLLFLSMGYP